MEVWLCSPPWRRSTAAVPKGREPEAGPLHLQGPRRCLLPSQCCSSSSAEPLGVSGWAETGQAFCGSDQGSVSHCVPLAHVEFCVFVNARLRALLEKLVWILLVLPQGHGLPLSDAALCLLLC